MESYEFGYKTFGPFLLGYTEWLKQCFQTKMYKKIFFLARDGYLMDKAFRIFADDSAVETEYVYFSRKSIRQALLWTCKSYEDSMSYMPQSRFITLGAVLEYYGFSKAECVEIAKENALSLEEEFAVSALKENEKIARLYDGLQNRIKEYSQQQYTLLLKYFQQIGMQGDCAIVDIGWHGNLQYYLEEVIRIADLQVNLDGYFLGICPNRRLQGEVSGYVFSPGNMQRRKSMLCFFGICERLFQSMEGSIQAYELKEQVIVPILEEYEYAAEQVLIDKLKKVHDGALQYIGEHKFDGLTEEFMQYSIGNFIRFGKYPSLSLLRLFSDFYNVDGTKVFYLPQKSLLQYNLREILHGLSNSTWKTGYMKQLFKLPFPYYWIYCLVRK